jgi:uncharacterized protein (TIGR02217 family)
VQINRLLIENFRSIRKLEIELGESTVLIGRNGALVTSGVSTDLNTGLVTFTVAPPNGHVVTAGYEFDVPVRFDEAKMTISIDAFNHGSVPSIAVKEIFV